MTLSCFESVGRCLSLVRLASVVAVFGFIALFAVDAQAQSSPANPGPSRPPRSSRAAEAVPPAARPPASGQLRLMSPGDSAADVPTASGAVGGPAGGVDALTPERRGMQAGNPSGIRDTPSGGMDPTLPGPNIKRLLEQGNGPQGATSGPPPLPEMRIRARVFARNKPPVAVIEVGGQSLAVEKGSYIQFSGATGGVVQFKVIDLTPGALRMEVVGREPGAVITLN